jgi:hypothetical protein
VRAPLLLRTRSHATSRNAGSATRLNTERLTPARVRRGFRHLRPKITLPARAPKPGRPGPGRPPGVPNLHRAPRPDVGKSTTRGQATTVQLAAGGRERHETVPVFDSESIDQLGTQLCPGSIATTTPQSFIVAFSPTRQAGYEVGRSNTAKERSCTASRPISARFEPAPRLRSFNHWFLSYTV